MVSTVLYEKNGVITEDRFKRLTHVQWWFHYKEILKQKEREVGETTEILKVARTMFDLLMDKLDQVGFMTNPDLGSKLYEEKEKKKREDSGEPAPQDDLAAFFESIKDITPETLTVEFEDKDKKSKFILPKAKRKVGIQINDKKAGD
jgi:hypothetical protein